ncbi:MAG TPA: type II toxin-antitoxin system RatA family toxin [Arenimonas sp.]|nr:type II toxin-antitoxin system RatA family toxin [Arenimonas sp.]
MPQIDRHALVRHSVKRMYDLVNSVERYPHWFAWCTGAQILEQSDTLMVAKLELRVAGIRSSFTTRNTLSPTHKIQMQLEEGGFKHLHGDWIFHALSEDACKVSLSLDFETSSLLAPAFAMGFRGLADKMVDDFCRQADRED